MRVLFASRGSSGHITPLAPLAHACVRAGHEVLVAAQAQNEGNVARLGLPFAPVGQPAPEDWMPLMGDFAQLSFEEANTRMVRDFFAGLDTAAALPGLEAVFADFRPDVVAHETWEFGSALLAERDGLPHVRVGLGLAAVEELTAQHVAATVDRMRAQLGLPADPQGERLRTPPWLSTIPEQLEDPAAPLPPVVHRFRHGVGDAGGEDPWPGGGDPLVLLTFGSVTAAPHLPFWPGLYRAAIDALAALPVRVLVTVGEARDHADLGALPANVRVERWVPQDDVVPHAALVVGHGGHGTTLGALAHGVPLVVLPLFSVDQFHNATAVARAGAGIAVNAGTTGRGALDVPGDGAVAELGRAVASALRDDRNRRAAQRIAAAMAALPPIDDAVGVLQALAR